MQTPQFDFSQNHPAGFGMGPRFHHHQHLAWRQFLSPSKAPKIPSEVLDQMELAASDFNRISGALEAGGAAGVVQRLRPKIFQAADEAMIDVLHQAQLGSQFPESIKSIQGRLTADLATLKELGDRVEAMTLREPTFTDMIARRTTADEVLEELRLEQSAVTELSALEDTRPRDHLQA